MSVGNFVQDKNRGEVSTPLTLWLKFQYVSFPTLTLKFESSDRGPRQEKKNTTMCYKSMNILCTLKTIRIISNSFTVDGRGSRNHGGDLGRSSEEKKDVNGSV